MHRILTDESEYRYTPKRPGAWFRCVLLCTPCGLQYHCITRRLICDASTVSQVLVLIAILGCGADIIKLWWSVSRQSHRSRCKKNYPGRSLYGFLTQRGVHPYPKYVDLRALAARGPILKQLIFDSTKKVFPVVCLYFYPQKRMKPAPVHFPRLASDIYLRDTSLPSPRMGW